MATATEARTPRRRRPAGVSPGWPASACGEVDAVRVGLEDLGFTCTSCDEAFDSLGRPRDDGEAGPACWPGLVRPARR